MKCILKVGKNEYDYNNGVLLIDNGFKYIGEDNKFGYLKLDEIEFVKSMDKVKEPEEDYGDSL